MAGGKAKPEMAAAAGVNSRALIEAGDRTLLQCAVDALRGADSIDRITVVGDMPDSPDYARVADHGGFVENLFAGLEACGGADLALVATADAPFVTAEVVEDFVAHGRVLDADLVYPVVEVAKCYERFPGMKRTAAPIREGRFTGGNMLLMRPAFMLSQRDRIASAYAARKSPLKLAMMLGLGTTLRAAVAITVYPRAIDLASLERAVGRLLGGKARCYVSPYPEIATDIDKPEDLAALRELG